MRLILINNWSILLGFILAVFALAGMALVVFYPDAVTVELTPSRAISALDVPLMPIEAAEDDPQEALISEVETFTIVEEAPEVTSDARIQPTASPNRNEITTQELEKATLPVTGRTISQAPSPEAPVRIVIPSIDLNAPILSAPVEFETIAGKEYMRWFVPDKFAVGWHTTSAMLGEAGNTVLNGHHNAFGEVFVSLIDVTEGDIIWVESGRHRFSFQVTNKMVLPEKYEQLDVRMNNAQWLLPTVDERLTLITCWPYESNTHRLIVVARPLGRSEITPILD
jgi:sortase A